MFHNPVYFIEASGSFDYPTLMQNIGLGLLALFTPLAILLIQDLALGLDKIVVIKLVLRLRRFVAGATLIFFSQFLYNFNGWNLFIGLCFLLGCVIICVILVDCYRWATAIDGDDDNFRNLLRSKYLENNKEWNDKKKIWALIWSSKIENPGIELNRLKIFVSNVDTLITEGNKGKVNEYLTIFYESLDKRDLKNWNFIRIVWSKSLEWHYRFYIPSDTEISDLSFEYTPIKITLDSMLNKLLLSGIKTGAAFNIFNELGKHIDNKMQNYLYSLVNTLGDTFFDNVDSSPEEHEIWYHYFKPDWKITYNNLESNKMMALAWGDNYFTWCQNRFRKENGYDSSLDSVTRGLFPNIDLILWSEILEFVLKSYISGERMKSLVESKKIFGFMSHIIMSHSGGPLDVGALRQAERGETYKLAVKLFPAVFTRDKINSYISELRSIPTDYDPDSTEFRRKESFKLLFEGFLEYLNSIDSFGT